MDPNKCFFGFFKLSAKIDKLRTPPDLMEAIRSDTQPVLQEILQDRMRILRERMENMYSTIRGSIIRYIVIYT